MFATTALRAAAGRMPAGGRRMHTLASVAFAPPTLTARIPRPARTAALCTAIQPSRATGPLSAPTATPVRFSTHAAKHSTAASAPTVFVCGGNGALGQAMISCFKNAGWRTICMDFKVNPHADVNIPLSTDKDWKANVALAEEKLAEIARPRGGDTHHKGKKGSISVMIHCAGSWMGGGAGSLLTTVDPMLDINLKSAISTAALASKYLTDEPTAGAMLLLTGAAAAVNQTPTPGMLAYGMSKAATHQLAVSLAHPDAGLPNATVVCFLPTMIDTPSNRAMISNPADAENWTPPTDFAALALAFAQQLQESAMVTATAAAKGAKKPKSAEHVKAEVEPAHAPLQQGGFYVFSTTKDKTTIKLLPSGVTPA